MQTIKDLETLRAIVGEPKPTTPLKINNFLTAGAQDYIRQAPLMLIATSDAEGMPTISPRGDFPGFVGIGDEQTLYLPERKGNNLISTLQNILQNPQVGLLFIVPGTIETLRVHGKVELTTDEQLCQQLSTGREKAFIVMVLKVTESYFQCGKAFMRGAIWQPESWPEKVKISFGAEIAANAKLNQEAVQEFDNERVERYKQLEEVFSRTSGQEG